MYPKYVCFFITRVLLVLQHLRNLAEWFRWLYCCAYSCDDRCPSSTMRQPMRRELRTCRPTTTTSFTPLFLAAIAARLIGRPLPPFFIISLLLGRHSTHFNTWRLAPGFGDNFSQSVVWPRFSSPLPVSLPTAHRGPWLSAAWFLCEMFWIFLVNLPLTLGCALLSLLIYSPGQYLFNLLQYVPLRNVWLTASLDGVINNWIRNKWTLQQHVCVVFAAWANYVVANFSMIASSVISVASSVSSSIARAVETKTHVQQVEPRWQPRNRIRNMRPGFNKSIYLVSLLFPGLCLFLNDCEQCVLISLFFKKKQSTQ